MSHKLSQLLLLPSMFSSLIQLLLKISSFQLTFKQELFFINLNSTTTGSSYYQIFRLSNLQTITLSPNQSHTLINKGRHCITSMFSYMCAYACHRALSN